MDTALAKKPNGTELAPVAPQQLLQMAVQQGANLEQLKQLMDLQERWERNEARKAFVHAMNQFKANPPVIEKNKHVKFGQTEYDHATLDHVCKQVTKGLGEHGISHRWRVDQENGSIKVVCILTHEMGHSEETALIGSPDTSGSKNGIQAIGSTVTYLQRYTLLAATGLAASNGDDDGSSSGPRMDDLMEHLDNISNACDITELQKMFVPAYRKAKELRDVNAVTKLIAAKDARKKELQ